MKFAPNTINSIKESLVGAVVKDTAQGVKILAHNIDNLTDPVTEPASNFVNDKFEDIKIRREARKAMKESVRAQIKAQQTAPIVNS